MNYYLAFIRTPGKDDGYYELVKANTKEEAIQKVKEKLKLEPNVRKILCVTETIE